MGYVSTRGASPVELATAVRRGLAEDGGLYLPERLDALSPDWWAELPGRSLHDTASGLLDPFLEGLGDDDKRRLIEDALDFPIPLVHLEDDVYVLELFHGPTLAFKDVGARLLARLMAHFAGSGEVPLTVLVATSGDTGSAVAQAFLDVPGTRVAVLYPAGKVSAVQEKQFTTLGRNIQALAVDGTFDDCQRLVKQAFSDEGLARDLRLTSANSINIGRLLPQMVYYPHALSQLGDAAAPVFATPSGNFGNLTAGVLAERLGMPCRGFVAATNLNDVVPEYLLSGRFAPRPSRQTLSSAMDVGDPSNFERLLTLFSGDREAMGRRIRGSRHDDEATRTTIAEVYERRGYLLDPHTAVGLCGLRQALRDDGGPGIVLATAHPAKFGEHIEPLLGLKIPLPERLAACLDRPSLALPLGRDFAGFEGFLRGWA